MRIRTPTRIGIPVLAVALAAMTFGAAACGPKRLPPPAASAAAPAFPTFERPELVEPLPVTPPAVVTVRYDEGWTRLQAGRPDEAAAIFAEVIRSTPAFYPARAAHGYARLAARDGAGAIASFDAALAARPGYVPALAGRAEALIAASRGVEAIAALEALIAADPQRTAARTRLETLRLQVIEGLIGEARGARQRGDLDAARAAWTRAVEASPDSADFLRELAQVERQANQLDAALTHARAALLLDDGDASGHALVGELESARGNLRPALEAFQRAAALESRPEFGARIEDLERRIDLAGMPVAFRSISERGAISRADLAALLGVRLEPLLAAARSQPIPLMTDVRGHWAQRWILDVSRAGIMEVFPNHTFQPGTTVRRSDLARVVGLLFTRVQASDPGAAGRWRGRTVEITDVAAGNAVREAADLTVEAGILSLDPGGAFSATRAVSGAEAIAAIDRLVALTGVPRR
ncbi:MAG: tetratricopeptide repeat protein [Vicinamibacteraceae bacterium]